MVVVVMTFGGWGGLHSRIGWLSRGNQTGNDKMALWSICLKLYCAF